MIQKTILRQIEDGFPVGWFPPLRGITFNVKVDQPLGMTHGFRRVRVTGIFSSGIFSPVRRTASPIPEGKVPYYTSLLKTIVYQDFRVKAIAGRHYRGCSEATKASYSREIGRLNALLLKSPGVS